jgi:hypothetical protein
MKYPAFLIVTLLAVFTISCQSGIANNTSASTLDQTPAVTLPTDTPQKQPDAGCKICQFDFASYKGELKKEEADGLLLALNDEYLATATYEQVNRDFGDPRPFVNIVRAEMRHAEMLKGLFAKYGLEVPANPWPGNVPKFKSVAVACSAGVDGEILNRDLYTRLFKTTDRTDILAVYQALQRASDENHLPAFQRCGGGRGPGSDGPKGAGPGRRGIE